MSCVGRWDSVQGRELREWLTWVLALSWRVGARLAESMLVGEAYDRRRRAKAVPVIRPRVLASEWCKGQR